MVKTYIVVVDYENGEFSTVEIEAEDALDARDEAHKRGLKVHEIYSHDLKTCWIWEW